MVEGNKSYLDSLNLLRGIAAVSVCFCHLGGALHSDHLVGIFDVFHQYGKYGVQMFFVISGFVIPLSFYRGGYALNSYFRFLYKRILRLHPPYLFAVLLTLIIVFCSYKLRHLPLPEDMISIVKMLFYLHVPQDNPVFWSLLVEVQYYVFIGLCYPLLFKYPKISVVIGIPLLALMSQISSLDSHVILFSYINYFSIGIIGFLIYAKHGSVIINYVLLVGVIIICFMLYDIGGAVAAFIAILTILFYQKPIPAYLQFFGLISYSMYLVHFPIGVKIINILKSHVKPQFYVLLFLITFLIITCMAWLINKYIEHPSETWSRKIKYRKIQGIRSPGSN